MDIPDAGPIEYGFKRKHIAQHVRRAHLHQYLYLSQESMAFFPAHVLQNSVPTTLYTWPCPQGCVISDGSLAPADFSWLSISNIGYNDVGHHAALPVTHTL